MIPVAKPVIGPAEVEAATRTLLSGWVTQGPEVAAFEREFAAYVGAPYAAAVANCTAALHLALLAVGVRTGDEVITASHSFLATANAIRYCDATPVFVDIQPDTFNMQPERIEAAIGPRTRAILAVHQIGMPCDIVAISAIARRANVPVIEDAACAVGSELELDSRWERIGKSHGDIACFSFHPRKLLTTGDGGMVTTSHVEFDRKIRLLRQHGMSVSDTQRHSANEVIFESYDTLGFNYRLTDIQAAIGRAQLQRLPAVIERRRLLAERYRTLLVDVPEIRLPTEPTWARSNWQSFCVLLPSGCNQRAVMQAMLDRGVSTRRAVMCAHREIAYAQTQPWSCGPTTLPGCEHNRGTCARLEESERIQDSGIVLPLFDALTEAEQVQVVEALRFAVGLTRVAAC